jgi:FlaA1/EpsC-like NDP-sugar epimerase
MKTFFLSQGLRYAIAFLHDLIAIPIAWFFAYWLRFNLASIPDAILQTALLVLPIVVIIQLVTYWFFGLYRGIWRFASVPDLIRIIKAVVVSTALIALILFFYNRMVGIPRSVFPLHALLLIAILGGSRLLYRWIRNKSRNDSGAQRVLIVGAGQAGEGLVRDMLRGATQQYKPIAFVDDDERKHGQEIHGIRVIGSSKNIVKLIQHYPVDLILIALPSASSADMRRIVSYCEEAKIPFRTLPSLKDLTSGRVSIDALRQVSIEDLLGREPVSLDWQQINQELTGKAVLVSGGGGSIGSELCRQIAKLNPARLVILESSEFNLYSIELELQQKFPALNLISLLVDVTDNVAVQNALSQHRPEIVFHAAAYKHVPLLESQTRAAVRNNILGARTLAEAAVAQQVKKFVLISTDKAVNPTNVMGTTKRAVEIFCQNFNKQANTRFITVRFGNVLDSAGSVVPLFRKQIAAGGPVTVTHPDITRFFMTIPEATQLILQATVMGEGGEIFVLDMGEPIKISYLAEQMIKLTGLKLGEEIEIKYTGLRPGEKLYEELFHESEQLANTQHHKILQAQYREWDWLVLMTLLEQLATACQNNNVDELNRLLLQLVPEYKRLCA